MLVAKIKCEIDAISTDFIGKFIDLEFAGLDSEAPNPIDVGEIGSKKYPPIGMGGY